MDGCNIAVLTLLSLVLLLVLMTWSNTQNFKTSLDSLKSLVNKQFGAVTGTYSVAGASGPGVNTIDAVVPAAVVRLYTASWCPLCKFFAPKWKELETIYALPVVLPGTNDIKRKVHLIKMDCSNTEDARKIINEIKLKGGEAFNGYPTITIQLNGDTEEESFAVAAETVQQITEKINLRISK